MHWKKLAPWNWFKEEEPPAAMPTLPQLGMGGGSGGSSLATARAEMERLFDDSARRLLAGIPSVAAVPGQIAALLRPSIDISEGKKAYTVRAELPGVEREDIALEVDGATLVIHAEKRQESDQEDEGYHCIERSYGAVQRVLSLPDDADGDAIEAKFKNGVLKLRIPKHPARASRGRSIEIQGG